MRRFLLALAFLLAPSFAVAQSVQQSGNVTVNHVPYWVTNGVVGDGGTASDSPISSIGVTNSGGPGLCVSTGRSTAAGRQQLCLSASLNGAGQITLQNYGTATPQNFQFVINGTTITLPTGGGTFVQASGTLISGDLPCWSGTAGVVVDCGYAIAAGAANKIPYWTSASAMSSMAAAASSVLVTSSGNVPSLSQTLPAAVQGNITTVGTVTSGTWAATPITVTGGGTGVATIAAHGAVIGEGTSPLTSVTTAQIGYCLLSQGASSDPIWASCASGTGTAGGSDTQVQFNNSTNLAGNANLTWVSPTLTIGQNATTTGKLNLANGNSLGVGVIVQNLGATSSYNFNLPTGAGSSGQPLISGGGAATSMTFGTLQVAGGGTNCSAASGTCLDNITNFGSTGYVNRTGPGSYAFSTVIPLSAGGTNQNLTASNGGIFYSTATAGAILSGTATANQVLLSGSSTTPAWSTATYPATTTISQILYSSSANVIAGIATGNSGVLITSAGGVPSISSTIPSATQDNITRLGTITSGVWNGTAIPLANGGTNANLTASTGGIFYSGASAGAILSGTATASLPMLSGSTAAPTWATISYPTSATSGGIPYFSSTSAIASSGLLTNHAIVLGAGAGASPTVLGSLGTTTTVLHGNASGAPSFAAIVDGDITGNTITNASLAQMAAVTLKGNPTNALANASDFTINGLTARGAPDASNDQLLIWDSAAGTLKKVTPAQVASSATSGVSSFNGLTGALNLYPYVSASSTTILTQVASPRGRLTMTSATPVMTATAGTTTTLYYDCYQGGNAVPYYDGTHDLYDTIAACEVSDVMVSAASAGQVVSGQVYDVWWAHGGANRICLAMSASSGGGGGWASDTGGSATARGTGYSQLDTTARPYITNKNAITNCFNAAVNYGSLSANQATYLGTVYASSNGNVLYTFGTAASGGGAGTFGVWNAYNRVNTSTTVSDNKASWTYGSVAWEAADNSATNRVTVVRGLDQDSLTATYYGTVQAGAASFALSGVGLDSTTAQAGSTGIAQSVNNNAVPASYTGLPGVGLHYVSALEYNSSATTATWIGSVGNIVSGFLVSFRN